MYIQVWDFIFFFAQFIFIFLLCNILVVYLCLQVYNSIMQALAQYRLVYELLRKHIINGLYPEGSILPSENALCRIHHLTRPTVRKALDALVNDGYIIKHQGKGSIVHRRPKEIGLLNIAGTTSALGKKNLSTRIISAPTVTTWPEPFMYALSEEEKTSGCIYMERLRMVNRKPIFFDINYLPNINLPHFCRRCFKDKSLFEILRTHYNIEIKGGEQRLRAMPADKRISKLLKINPGHPVLHLERKISTNRKDFYFYSSLYCNTEDAALHGYF